MKEERSAELFAKAQRFMPGGVNSPVRAFRNVGRIPRFIKKAKGARIFDEDGNEYYCLYWEGEGEYNLDFSEGFCVKGEDTADFLRETFIPGRSLFRCISLR